MFFEVSCQKTFKSVVVYTALSKFSPFSTLKLLTDTFAVKVTHIMLCIGLHCIKIVYCWYSKIYMTLVIVWRMLHNIYTISIEGGHCGLEAYRAY